jgi:hypothetical protein
MRFIPNLADANPFPHADAVQIVYRLTLMFAEHCVRVNRGHVVSTLCPVCHNTTNSTNSIAVDVNKEQSKVLVGEAKEYTEIIS